MGLLRARALLAVVSLMAVFGLGSLGDARAQSCADVRVTADGWERIAPKGLSAVTSYAVVARDFRKLYATDGEYIVRSIDAGCSFTVVRDVFEGYSFQGGNNLLPEITTPSHVVQIVSAPSGRRIYAVIQSGAVASSNDPAPATSVLTSVDDGATWSSSSLISPISGIAVGLTLTGTDGETSYLATHSAVDDRTIEVHRSTDGRTWQRTTPLNQSVDARRIVADPVNSAVLYAWGGSSGRLQRSSDAGMSFQQVEEVKGGVTLGATIGERTTAAFTQDGRAHLRTTDASWQSQPAPPGIDSATQGPGKAQMVVTAGGRAALLGAPGAGSAVIPFAPAGISNLADAQATTGSSWRLHLSDHQVIYRRGERPAKAPADQPVASLPVVVTPALPAIRTVELRPQGLVVKLHPGESQSEVFTLALPPRPTPLDVMFLVDTTGSMQPTINGLRHGIATIVKDLNATGVDAYFGLGDFQDYADGLHGLPGDYPYRRDLAVSAPGPRLAKAINDLTIGGGGDGPESDLAALYYSTTGRSQAIIGSRRAGGYYVKPDQGAQYRAGSVRVAIIATDSPFNQGVGYPGPSFAEAIDALVGQRVKVVGLDVSDSDYAAPDLKTVAQGTGALAPEGGLDCDGDGRADLSEGAPLVCPVNGSGSTLSLAPAILNLLHSLRDDAPVDFGLAAPTPQISVAGPSRIGGVNLKEPHELHTRLAFRCPANSESSTSARLESRIRGKVVAGAEVRLECRAADPSVDVPPVAPVVAAVAAVALAPPAPAHVPAPNPNPQPNPNANPQANFGAATEEQERSAMAFAESEVLVDEQTVELAMSRRENDSDLWQRELLALGMMSAVASALVLRTRRALAHSRAS